MKEHKIYDIVIAGGGASSMAAAIEAQRVALTKDEKLNILIIEKKEKLGSKLRATGNGRCNISNVSAPNYNEVKEFFKDLGILTREEEGRLYPFSSDANQLAEFLGEKLKALNVEISLKNSVLNVKKEKALFLIQSEKIKDLRCKKLLIATGGKSYPSLGTTGDGYIISKSLNHKVNTLIPALTPVVIKENIEELKGIRVDGEVKLLKNRELIKTEYGNIQFRKDSLSGICIMNLSNLIRRGEDYRLKINFIKGFEDEIQALLNSKMDETIYNQLLIVLKEALIMEILARAEVSFNKKIRDLDHGEIQRLMLEMSKFTLNVEGLKGWNEAQVTSGGVELSQIDENMESKLIEGLYFAGEILDYVGICGGYNLDFAWYSGIKAGKGMALKCIE